jgi:hypothetical protein
MTYVCDSGVAASVVSAETSVAQSGKVSRPDATPTPQGTSMGTNEPSPVEFLADPLSSISRAERRNLLIASAVGVLVARAGLVPTRFSTFGLEFQEPEQRVLIWVVLATVVYFMFAFALYGVADFLIWRTRYQDYLEGVEQLMSSWTQEDQQAHEDLHKRVPDIGWLYQWSKPAALARILFEFVVPVMFSFYAVISLGCKLRTL